MEMEYEYHIVGLGRGWSRLCLARPTAIKFIEIGHDVSRLEVPSRIKRMF